MQPDDEERQLRSVALQNVQSIQQARQRTEQELRETKEALEEETRVLELLNRTGTMLSANLELSAAVQAVTDAGTRLSGARFGAFFYTDVSPSGEVLTLYALSGAPREAFERFGHPRATPVFGPTFRNEGVVRVADILADPRYGKMGPHHGMPPGHLPVRSYLAVPVVGRSGEVIGGLFFGHPDPGIFSERIERLIVGIAAHAAIAIDNARLYEQARRAADDRTRMLEAERAARAESDRLNRMKDEFLATLSHELRTPLSAVLGWSQALMMREPTDPKLRQGLDAILRNGRAQARLIEDLLDMNRIMSGKVRLEVQKVDLGQVVAAALQSIAPSAQVKGITVRKSFGPEPALVSGDPDRLQQIVWNLLSNAVKFTPRDGTVEVLLRRVGAQVELSVRDTGVGITEGFLPHVFDRFRQADASTVRKHGGLGLGLSIVKHLVELHGATIHAESPGPDAGATFTVSLPVREPPTPAEEARERATEPHQPATLDAPLSLEGLDVLVVDDQPDARELLEVMLGDARARVRVAASVDEALSLMQARVPDIIISDIGMPERDGYAFLRAVRALPANRGGATPAIALTAFARAEDRTRVMRAGFQLHLSKPIDAQELLASVQSLIERDRRGGAKPGAGRE